MEEMCAMTFAWMKPGEEAEVSRLVWQVFEEFEASEYKQEGIDEFKQYIAPEVISSRCAAGRFFVVCCKRGEEIVGVAAVRDNRHLSLLFVRREDQRKGIARRLLGMAIEACREIDPELQSMTVNSSRYAVAVYEKLGFESTGPEEEKNGIRFTPMRLGIAARESFPP